ncbi:DUF2786 domain-containing protein [Paracoccus sp. IB05]|uniref:DUF7168 domain-containing protein n=1 Tax=Paracoccus sp. IB05 TaxID=2779367 RepID=UPI0018E88175|nr:DUF2786 domain-containing protein [Paracoccus sp. IB05]MBJ2150648.1 DUF2786 domain-containing protein [Paracoccus sp. IB05]
MSVRADIIAKVRSLRARAGDSASSEGEAAAAARIAAKIIAENQLTEAELRQRGAGGVSEATHNDGRARKHPALDAAAAAIGLLTECTALVRGGANIWIGQPDDVAFAIYLCELIEGASERAYRAHWTRRFTSAPRPFYRQSFMAGFGHGVAQRMVILTREREAERKRAAEMTSSTDLVVVKGAIIADYLAETRPMLRTERTRARKEPDTMALLSGLHASKSLLLSRPVECDAPPSALSQEGEA